MRGLQLSKTYRWLEAISGHMNVLIRMLNCLKLDLPVQAVLSLAQLGTWSGPFLAKLLLATLLPSRQAENGPGKCRTKEPGRRQK